MAHKVPALVLLRSPAPRERDDRPLTTAGLRVSRGQVLAGPRHYPLAELRGVDLEHSAPRWVMVPLAAAFATMMVGLPVLQSQLARAPSSRVPLLVGAVVCTALFFFTTLLRFLGAHDRYAVVLETVKGKAEVFQSADRSEARGVARRLRESLDEGREAMPRESSPAVALRSV